MRLSNVLFICLVVCWPLLAQESTGRVVGTVTDPTGAAVPGARITVTEAATGVSRLTATDHSGNYQVLDLPIGAYTVKIEAPGFTTVVTKPEELRINQSLRFDAHLAVGKTSQTVEVEASGVGVETVDSSLGGSVTEKTITNTPLNGRNTLDLIKLQAGATEQRNDPGATPGAGLYSISGGRTDSVAFLLDGVVNNDLLDNGVVLNPNPDMIEEFRVITSNGSAEYGRNAGGIVTAVVKSGTNALHGSFFDYLRNDDMDANRFFFNEQGLPRPTLKRNQFGATLNGPVEIPHVIDGRDKFFFSFGYQGQRQSDVLTTPGVTTFTPAELAGDFSHAVNGGPDPNVASFLESHPYFQSNPALAAQAIIDPSRIGTVAQNYINAGLIPTSPTGSISPAGPETVNNDEVTAKLDYSITQNDRLAVILGANRAPSVEPFNTNGYGSNTPGLPYSNNRHTYLGSIEYTKVFSPTLLNEIRFGAQRDNELQGVPVNNEPTAADLGMAITPDLPTGPPMLDFDASGLIVGAPAQGPTSLISNTYNFSDTLSWVRGAHTVKTGFNFTDFQNNMTYDFIGNGMFDFYGPAGNNSGNDLADFLMGMADDFLQYPNAPTDIRTRGYAGFAQDEWRLKKNLVLTVGLRYEYSTPKSDTEGRTFSIIPGDQSTVFPNAPLGLVFPGDAGAPSGVNFPDRSNWAPRFGFAWTPNAKTSIRGGFGIYYDILKAEDNLQFNGQAPFFSSVYFPFNPVDPASTSAPTMLSDPYGTVGRTNPFPSTPPSANMDFTPYLPFGGNGVFFVDPHLTTPYVYQYNLTLQRELAHDLVLQVAYVGSDSHKLTGLIDINPFPLGTDQRVLGSNFSFLNEFANVGTANYNSLQVQLEKKTGQIRYLGSMAFKLSYTWGHEIDNESGFRERSAGEVPSYDPELFRASGDEDIRQNLIVSGGWELPFAQAWPTGPKRLTKGWTLLPIFLCRTGYPLDITAGLPQETNLAGPSGAGDAELVRANLVGSGVTMYDPRTGQSINGNSGNYWFNPGNFTQTGLLEDDSVYIDNPSARTYGTLGRNAFRGPGRVNLDLALTKDTPLWGERVKSQLRIEAFNALNHAEFYDPNTTITSSLFGQITDTYDPRILQVALRLEF